MNKSAAARKKAFFDAIETQTKTFWQQGSAKYFSNIPLTLEETFYYKENESSNQWQNCILCLHGHYLVYKSKKGVTNVMYLNLDENFYKLEVIRVEKKKGDKKDLTGFSLSKNGTRAEFLSKKAAIFLKWRNELAKFCLMMDFFDNYKTMKILGTGGYGKVFLIEESIKKIKYAGKFIKINPQKNREKQLTMIKNEIQALKKLNHPHILKLHEMYELDEEICLVLDYIEGDRLFDEIVKRKGIPERETALIMKQIFSMLNYMEYKDIIHRDLKPENILLTRDSQRQLKLILIDFGLATFNSKRDIIKKGGTAGYAAPEILNDMPYTFKVDLYSAGVIMFTCLTGKPLFSGVNYNDLLEKNRKGVIRHSGKTWAKFSPKCKDLLQSILEPNPSRRITLEKVLQHPWFAAELTPHEHQEFLENTIKFGQMEVPKESIASRIPESVEVASQFISRPSHQDIGLHSGLSATWLTSQYAMESGNFLLNSFYKMQTSRSSIMTERSNQDLDSDTPSNEPKSNVLSLPGQKGTQKSLTAQSIGSLNIDIARRFEGYNIKIHTIGVNSLTEFDSIANDEEDDPCSTKYAQLTNQDLFFDNVNFANPVIMVPLVQKTPHTKSLLNIKSSNKTTTKSPTSVVLKTK